MSIDNITREEFQLYRQAQDKERLIDRIRSSLGVDYGLAAFSGVVASVGGIATAVAAYADKPELAILNGTFTLANVGFLVYRGGRIADKYKEIGKAEGELEQIKENPTYKKLDLIE